MVELFWLSDGQWSSIEPLLPHLGGKPRVDDRRVISGILHRFREGLRWRALPDGYGPRTTLFNRFNRWSQRGLWQELYVALAAASLLFLPWWTALPCARTGRRRAQRGEQNQAIGRSRGGRTTKIHALCDIKGRLYALLLTGGNVHDLHGARALLAAVPTPRDFLVDIAYDSNDIRAFLTAHASHAVIPPKRDAA